jgi:tetratricopeptide (TPR) repeat protein
LWLGLVLSAAGRAEEAEAALRRAVELSPTTPEVWVALVQCLVRYGQKARARDSVGEAELRVPEAASSLALARCHELIDDFRRAEALYLAGVEAQRPSAVAARAALAGFYLRRGRTAEAEVELEKIVDLQKKAPEEAAWAGRMLAVLLAGRDDYEKAQRALKMLGLDEQGKAASRGTNEEKRARAVALAAQKSLAMRREATRLLEELFVQEPPLAEEQFFLARLYESIGEPTRSRVWLLRLLGVHSGEPRYVAHYAAFLLQQRDLAEAEDWVARLEKLAPRATGTLRLKARLLAAQGKKEAAVSLVLAAGQRKEMEAPAVASLLEEIGDGKGAEKVYLRFIEESRRPEARLQLAALLARQGQGSAGLDQCELARKDCPPEAVVRACISIVYAFEASDADLRRVEGWLLEARTTNASSVEWTVHLAALRNRQGRYDAAEQLYRQILEREPGNIAALNNLSCLLALRGGKADEALALVSRAMKILGPVPYLLDTRAVVYLANKRSDLAVKDLQDALAEAPTASGYFHLARAHRDASHRLEALAAMRKAIDMGLTPNRLHGLEKSTHQQLLRELVGPG